MKIKFFLCAFSLFQFLSQSVSYALSSELGGFGNVNVKARDITLKDLIGDINVLNFNVTSCNNDVSSSCGSGSVCNVTVGPCSVNTGGKMNAAPSNIVFSRFLSNINPYRITVNKPNTSMPLIGLEKKYDYTTIIECPFGNVFYMFIALPTDKTYVDAIKNLPLGLARYLKQQDGTIIKVYRASTITSPWVEITEIKIDTSLNDKIAKRSNIINVEFTENGNLVLTYKNLKKHDNTIIPTTRVTYTND